MDPTAILVDNLRDALEQVRQYLGLGLVASISAYVLHRQSPLQSTETDHTEVLGIPVKMPRQTAQLVLLGAYFVTGMMGYIAAESAVRILSQLSAPIRLATCSQASIVTSAVGYRIIAASLPILFVLPILWRLTTPLRNVPVEDRGGVLALIGFFMLPYLALAMTLFRVHCGS